MSPVPSPTVPSSSLHVGFAVWDEVSGTRALSTSPCPCCSWDYILSLPWLALTPQIFLILPALPEAPKCSWSWGCHPTLFSGRKSPWVEIYPFPLLLEQNPLGLPEGSPAK